MGTKSDIFMIFRTKSVFLARCDYPPSPTIKTQSESQFFKMASLIE